MIKWNWQLSNWIIDLGIKIQDEICDLKLDNCDVGLKCKDVKDGCNNGIGRCKHGIFQKFLIKLNQIVWKNYY